MLVASSERIRSLLGWQPRFSSVEEIVRSAWSWHQSHPRGYVETPTVHAGARS